MMTRLAADFESIVDISPFPIVLHRNGIIRYANKLILDLLGTTDDSRLINRNLLEFVYQDDRAMLASRIAESVDLAGPNTVALIRFVDVHGQIIPIQCRSTDVQFRGEACRLVYVYNFDNVTLAAERERQQRELDLSNYRSFQEKVNAVSPVSISILDVQTLEAIYRSVDMAKWLKYEPEKLPKGALALIHPDYHPQAKNYVAELLRLEDGAVATDVFPVVEGTGSIRYMLSRGSVFLRDEQGVPRQVLIALSDVTDLKNTESRLGEIEESRKAILCAIPDMVFTVGNDGIIVDFYPNESHRELLGDMQFVGQSIASIVPENQHGLLFRTMQRAISEQTLQSMEFEQEEQHFTFYYEFRISPLNDHQVIVIVRDVSDIKAVQRKLDQTNRELFEKNQQLERYITSNTELEKFAYIASHDLREPLRSLTGFAQLLQRRNEGKLTPESEEFIQNIITGAGRMNTLISGLLDFSRVSTSGKPFTIVNLPDLLKKVQADLKTSIEENEASILYFDLPEVYCDELQIRQLFQNLFSNAIKFHAQAKPVIKVTAESKDKHWLFKVEDNGIGMDMKYRDQVFQLFTRLHSHDKYQGSGIGLSICRKITERHNGQIWLESAPGKGTTVFFTLQK